MVVMRIEEGVFMERVERGEGCCGAQGKLKDRPRVFWGLCICARTWWEPNPLAILFYVGPPHGNMVHSFTLIHLPICLLST